MEEEKVRLQGKRVSLRVTKLEIMDHDRINSTEDNFDDDEEESASARVPDLDEDDLYSVLTIPRDASSEDIVQAYRRLSRVYHPDKHMENKDKAQEMFGKIKKAYEVLSNPARRAVYNEIGMKGLESEGNEMILRYQTPQEIQEEYERVNREREERELERKTNPRGTITVNLNATELFSPYLNRGVDDEDYYSRTGPLVEFSGFHFGQSIDVPLTTKDTFVMSGAVNAQNGRGRGNINCGFRKTLTDKTWGEIELGGSTSGFEFGLKGFHQLSRRYYVNFSALCQTNENNAKPAMVITLGSQLDTKSLGTLTWRMGALNGVQSVYIREIGGDRCSFCVHLGFPHSYASIQVARKKEDNKFRVGARAGTFGAFVEYGIEKRLSPVSSVGATMFVGLPLGVNLRFKVVRSHQTYLFPIQLAEEIVPSAVFYGTAIPFLVWVITKKLFLEPFEKEKLLREKEKKKMTNKTRMQAKRVEAENAVLLMAETYKRVKIDEEKKNGLIVVSALYGRLITGEAATPAPPRPQAADGRSEPAERRADLECIDVTIPLQCMVKDSKLILHDGSKNSLPGFYDPALGEDKNLMVKYRFRGELHEIVVRETEPLKIPKQAHRVDPL